MQVPQVRRWIFGDLSNDTFRDDVARREAPRSEGARVFGGQSPPPFVRVSFKGTVRTTTKANKHKHLFCVSVSQIMI